MKPTKAELARHCYVSVSRPGGVCCATCGAVVSIAYTRSDVEGEHCLAHFLEIVRRNDEHRMPDVSQAG